MQEDTHGDTTYKQQTKKHKLINKQQTQKQQTPNIWNKTKSKTCPPPLGQTGKTQRGLHLRRTHGDTTNTQTNTPIKHKQTIFEEEKSRKQNPSRHQWAKQAKHREACISGGHSWGHNKQQTNKLTNNQTNNQTIFETNQNKSIQSVILQDVHFTYRTAWCFPPNIYVPVETTVLSLFVYLLHYINVQRCSLFL